MRVPLSWLRELVPVQESAAALAERLPMLGLGVDGVEQVGREEVLDLQIPSNRPDLLGMMGIAREIAAGWRLELRPPRTALPDPMPAPGTSLSAPQVTVEEPDLCPRFTAHLIGNVRVGPAPDWMATRLEASGLRAINNVVDITNYVMLELGQPMHAFDLDRLAGRRLVVRRARKGERLTTLDGVERTLDPDVLVVADAERAAGIAGIIGGSASEIGPSTQTVLLEAASWAREQIRRTSRRLGIRTESSARFERGVDARIVLDAARRAAALIIELGRGTLLGPAADIYPKPVQPSPIRLRGSRIRHVLGIDVPADQVEGILRRLGCRVEQPEKDGKRRGESDRDHPVWLIASPPGRVDLELEEDLIEEVARHFGYDRIPETLPVALTQSGSRPAEVTAVAVVRDTLVRAGLTEALTISLIEPSVLDRLGAGPDEPVRGLVALANPFLADHTHLRSMMLPGLLNAVVVNQSRRVEGIHLFEVGHTFHPVDGASRSPRHADGKTFSGRVIGTVVERQSLGVVMTGPFRPGGWGRTKDGEEAEFFDIKGVLEALCGELGLDPRAEPIARPWLHPGRAAGLVINKREIGVFGELHPLSVERWGLRGRVYVAELDLDRLLDAARLARQFVFPPRFPAVDRDLAVILPAELANAEIMGEIRAAGGELLEGVDLFDVYAGPQVAPGHRSLAYRLRFRASDRTLTTEEVDRALGTVRTALERRGGRVRE